MFSRIVNSLPRWPSAISRESSTKSIVSLSDCGDCAVPCEEHKWRFGNDIEQIDYKSDLQDTAKYYDSHWVICGLGQAADWPSLPKDTTLAAISTALKEKFKNEKLVISCVEKPMKKASSGDFGSVNAQCFDLIKFPAFQIYEMMTVDDIPRINEREPGRLHDTNHLLLICGHMQRDPRCGRVAPRLLEAFRQLLPSNAEAVLCSHLGGHKFAANLIVYANKNAMQRTHDWNGVWYGRVQECHVPAIINETVVSGKIIKELHRGGGCLS